ncbi:MAG: transposase [Kiritimatiellae bacterium]|nr:transposase [Kiritimatiellia bacterium]
MTDELKNAVRQEVKHHMGRRCFNWDYSSRCIYMITITLADRSRPILGRLVGEGEEWRVEPSESGRIVEQCWREIPQQWPGVEIIESQLMPDHFHGIIFVKEQQKKKLGNIIGSFKSKSSSRAGDFAARGEVQNLVRGEEQNPVGLWAPGYVDLILFRAGQLEKMIAYIRDNPRRLGIKLTHPELFKVARDIEVGFAPARERAGIPLWGGPAKGHFMAIGNHFLLTRPVICQIQCSRSYFAYKRRRLPGGWQICRDSAGKPIIEKSTPTFEEKAAAALCAAAKGAVLLSPCISHGEREIARRVFEAGHRVITLQNKGFSPLYKPGGKFFEMCAAGNLLMLAPISWPYVSGEKAMTREQAQVLNCIAQLIADDGAVEIDYKGVVLSGIDEAVAQAVTPGICSYGLLYVR